jgi:hypothetical protein
MGAIRGVAFLYGVGVEAALVRQEMGLVDPASSSNVQIMASSCWSLALIQLSYAAAASTSMGAEVSDCLLLLLLLLLQAQAPAGVCEPVWWAQASAQGVAAGGSSSAGSCWGAVRGAADNTPGAQQQHDGCVSTKNGMCMRGVLVVRALCYAMLFVLCCSVLC